MKREIAAVIIIVVGLFLIVSTVRKAINDYAVATKAADDMQRKWSRE